MSSYRVMHQSIAAVCAIVGALGVSTLAIQSCTKQQAADVTTMLVQVAVGLCQEAPQVIPPGTSAGTVVGLLCPLVNDATKLVPVIVSAAGWNALKAEAAAKDAGVAK